jgi:glycosyltransferase involved in cell wall biosynthesis
LQNKFGKIFQHSYSGNVCGKKISMMSKILLPNSTEEAKYITIAWDVPKEKIHIIPNGVDKEFYYADPAEFKHKYGLENFILGVGSLSGRKNYDLLAEVCCEMEIPLVLIGELGNSTKSIKIKKLADKYKNIIMIEHIDHDSSLLRSAYAAADILALPSDFETPGLVALEGALAGCKVLITEIGGTREYFLDYAYYVKPRKKSDLKKGLNYLLNKKKDNKLKEHILKNYTWDKVAKKTYDIYKKLY